MRNGDFSVGIVPHDGGRVRELESGHVLARPGQVYRIRLRNHGPLYAVAHVELDGHPITAGGLVLAPLSTTELERPINDGETGRFVVVSEGDEGTFGPDGGTGHSDHIAACRWTTRAVQLAGLRDTRLMYATKTRRWHDEFFAGVDPASVMMVEGMETEALDESELGVWFECDDELLPRKVAALRAQVSQVEPLVSEIGLEAFGAAVREEFFRDPLSTDTAFIERMRSLGSA